MTSEKAVAVVALVWLVGAVFLMARLIRRGRRLTTLLANQYPESYEAYGRPRPGYFHSARRNSFSQFLARREYRNLGDAELATQFENYRKAEARALVSLLATLLLVAALVLWVRSGN